MDAKTLGHQSLYVAGRYRGLTKRDYFAGLAMQGLCANPSMCTMSQGTVEQIAEWSREHADALLAALAKAGDQ